MLAAQGMTKANGMTDTGNAANVKKWILDTLDSETFAYSNNGTAVENQLQDMDLNYYMPDTVTYLSRSDWKATWPKTYKDLTATDEMIEVMKNDLVEIKEQGNPDEVTFGEDNGLTLASLKGETDLTNEKWTDLIDQITLEEAMIRTGFGGTSTKSIVSIVSPEAVQNDGPNGFNSYTLGQYANTDTDSADPYVIDPDDKNLNYKFGTMSNETVIAQTFSKEMAAEYGAVTGIIPSGQIFQSSRGAGTNLHRTPYNARNHEYYSEDSMLTNLMGVAVCTGGTSKGLMMTPKHFAFNNMELNRSGLSTFMTEQAGREMELRGFQGAMQKNVAKGIMTAFNRVGTVFAGADEGVQTQIARNEWGYTGWIVTDMINGADYMNWKDSLLGGGGTMLSNPTTYEDTEWGAMTSDKNMKKIKADSLFQHKMKEILKTYVYTTAQSNAMNGISAGTQIVYVNTWWQNLIVGIKYAFGALTVILVVLYLVSLKKNGKEKE